MDEASITALKAAYALPGTDFELHAKDFCVLIKEQDEIPDFESLDRTDRHTAVVALQKTKLEAAKSPAEKEKRRAKYRAQRPFAHLTRIERSRLLEDALDLVGSQDGLRLFGEAVAKRRDDPGMVRDAFTQVVSRFDYFLASRNRDLRREPQHGLLVMDKEPTNERMLEKLHNQFRESGHPWGRIQFVIESPFFVDSQKARGVQIIDLCTYAVRRYLQKGLTAEASYEEQNFLRIFHKFDRSGARLHGLRHNCPKGTCGCLICRDRGHAGSSGPALGA